MKSGSISEKTVHKLVRETVCKILPHNYRCRERHGLFEGFVQSVQETGTYSDGGGLNLRVEKSGAKYWFQRVTIDRKRRNLGLGGYPTVSLAEARKATLLNTRMIRKGRDPLAEKR